MLAFMMIAAGVYYTFTGREGEVIPNGVTRVSIDESITVIPARAFQFRQSIEEVDCHDRVKTVEEGAFRNCRSLRIVIMLGVEIVGSQAFRNCYALTDVECGKLERIENHAFAGCKSLGSINFPSAKIVERSAFNECAALTEIKFGKELESISYGAFSGCTSLQRINIPLKDDIITHDNTFQGCKNLKHVDLVERAVLRDTIAALLLEEWKNYMNEEINAINQSLPTTPAGSDDFYDVGEKAEAVQSWIRSVLRKTIHYKAQHQHVLEEAAATLQLQVALPQDIVIKNVLPFLELPSHTFEEED
eukprot:scaffold1952_cov85-Skeletonema_dohrnii-CCMP3373.AAC.1